MAHNTARLWLALIFLSALAGASPCAAAARPPHRSTAQVINPELTGGLLVGGSRVLLVWGSDGTILRSEDGAHWAHAVTPGSADSRASRRMSAETCSSRWEHRHHPAIDRRRPHLAAGAQHDDGHRPARCGQSPAAAPGSRRARTAASCARSTTARTGARSIRSSRSRFRPCSSIRTRRLILIGGDEGIVGFSKNAGSPGRSPRSRCRSRPHRSPRFIVSANYCSPPARSADS